MKKLILGLTVGMLIGSVTTALAATQGEVTAVFANFIFSINGQEKKMDTTPLVYEGTSYLPVRAMAGLVGYEVAYAEDTRTINLKGNNAPVVKPEPPFDSSLWVALSELSLVPGIKVTISLGTPQINLEYHTLKFVFTLPNSTADEKIAISDPGNIKMLIREGTTYLNRNDLAKAGLPH